MNKHTVLRKVAIRIDQNVIKIHDYGNIEHVTEDVVHELLKCSRNIGESLWNDQPLEGTILHLEHSFSLLPLGEIDKMVCMMEVDSGVEASFARGIGKVVDEQKRVLIFLHDFVQTMEIAAQTQRAILLLSKENRHAMTGL